MSIHIRKAQPPDCPRIAVLHKELLPMSFLASLNRRFVSLLYKALLCWERGVVLVAEDNKEVVGFVCGVPDTSCFYKYFLKRNFMHAGFLLLPQIVKKGMLRNILKTFKYGSRKVNDYSLKAELFSIALTSTYQGKGVGEALFRQFVGEFHDMGIKRFKVIVGCSLARAQRFYQKMGCKKSGETESHKGKKSEIYVYNIK